MRKDIDTDKIIKLYNEDRLSVKDIALKLNCSKMLVYRRLSDKGICKRISRDKFFQENKDKIINMYLIGMTIENIKKNIGVYKSYVSGFLKSEGYKDNFLKYKLYHNDIQDDVVQLYIEGYGIPYIKNKFKIHQRAVYNILKNRNIEIRKQGRKPKEKIK